MEVSGITYKLPAQRRSGHIKSASSRIEQLHTLKNPIVKNSKILDGAAGFLLISEIVKLCMHTGHQKERQLPALTSSAMHFLHVR